MTRKAVVLDIRIILVNSVLHAKQKGFAEQAVHTNPLTLAACEVNHELIRRILPKGSSFDEMKQQDITLIMNHINSYKRKKLNNRSPYETFSFYYGEDVLKKLGCSPVAAENIILKPKLLKK